MKQSIKKLLSMFMLLIIPIYFYSCSDDEKSDPKILLPKTEGFFVFGTHTVAAAPTDPSARMALAQLDPGHGPSFVDSVYGKYMYIEANSNIQFALVNGDGEGVLFGADEVTVENGVDAGFSVNDDIIHGTLAEGEDAIEVTNEGLYYVFANMNTLKFVLTEVKPQIIGDAVKPDGWDAGVPLALKSISETETVWEATNVEMGFGGGYKYRFNDGWASYQDADFATHSHLGIEDYQAAWDAQAVGTVGWFPSTIPSFAAGMYTVNLKYTHNPVGEGTWVPTLTKTSEVLIDYSSVNMAIIGSAITGTCFCGDGTGGYQAHNPVKVGNVYTWTWNDVSLIEAGDFIFLEDATWPPDHLLIDYLGATVGGTGVPTKVNDATQPPASGPDHNYHVITAGVYDITLVIDAAANTKTVTINNN